MLDPMRILVVEDDRKIASFIVNGLKQSGFAVDHSADGENGLIMAQSIAYDAAVVDLMLPKLDGLSLIQQLRAKGTRIPVLILSAKASVDDRVKGLQAGGDDYLTKPFAFSELLARIQALIRRATQTAEPTRLVVGDLTGDCVNCRHIGIDYMFQKSCPSCKTQFKYIASRNPAQSHHLYKKMKLSNSGLIVIEYADFKSGQDRDKARQLLS